MTPAARIQAASEILDQVIAAAKASGPPADRIIADYFRSRRYAGSKDRRAVRDHVYAAVRLCGEVPATGRAAMLALAAQDAELAALFDGSVHGPSAIGPDESSAKTGLAPAWLITTLADSGIGGEEATALLDRAPLDIRINGLKSDPATLTLPLPATALPATALPTPYALRLPTGTPVEQWPAHQNGLIEVQDLGSQYAALAVAAQPGDTVIDLCAGAGGKTLALAAVMANQGRLLACDSDRGRLSRLPPRAERAGATMIESLLLNPTKEAEMLAAWHNQADAVLVDAPCSGSGTWRRNPEARWRLTPIELERLGQLQARLLDVATLLVRPGGRLVYVTCSLLDAEGAAQIDAFLTRHPGWQATRPALPAGQPHGQGLRLTPFHDDTDGFFIASLLRAC